MKSLKHSCLWSLICIINSAFGFLFALSHGFSQIPMQFGILVFLIFFTLFPRTQRYKTIKDNSILFRSLIIGYIINSILIPAHFLIGAFSVDIISTGSLTLSNSSNISLATTNFIETFLITITMGLLLNVMALIISAFIYSIQKISIKIFCGQNIYNTQQ